MSSPNGTPAKRSRAANAVSDSQTPSEGPTTPSRRLQAPANASQTPSQNSLRTPNRNRMYSCKYLIFLNMPHISEFVLIVSTL